MKKYVVTNIRDTLIFVWYKKYSNLGLVNFYYETFTKEEFFKVKDFNEYFMNENEVTYLKKIKGNYFNFFIIKDENLNDIREHVKNYIDNCLLIKDIIA